MPKHLRVAKLPNQPLHALHRLINQLMLNQTHIHIDNIITVDSIKPTHRLPSLIHTNRHLPLVAVIPAILHHQRILNMTIQTADPLKRILHPLRLKSLQLRQRKMLQLTPAALLKNLTRRFCPLRTRTNQFHQPAVAKILPHLRNHNLSAFTNQHILHKKRKTIHLHNSQTFKSIIQARPCNTIIFLHHQHSLSSLIITIIT